jgi:hypothetical protein
MKDSIYRARTRFKVFFGRTNSPHCEEAMNELLKRVDDWASEGNKTILAWQWKHKVENMGKRLYIDIEVIYSEIVEVNNT